MAIKNYAVVTLSPVHYPDSLDGQRILVFNSEYDTIEVGRSSKTEGKRLEPDVNNAWFSSRVISRTHARIWTNPEEKKIYLKDVGSMHGTFLGDVHLPPNITHNLINGDAVRFGSEVTRGSDTYPPLKMRVTYEWKERHDTSGEHTTSAPLAPTPSRHARVYSVPEDDSEDDLYQADDHVRESPEPSVPRNSKFSVPDSDASDAGSFEDDVEIADTPPSSAGKLMQSTIDLINRPLNTSSQTEKSTVAPSQADLPPRGPSGLTEDEKRDDERTFRAMGLRESERVLVVLDGEEDGSQNHPIPVDYDTINLQQESSHQGASCDAQLNVTKEPESEEIASESDNPSLFDDCENDMDDMDDMDALDHLTENDDTDGFSLGMMAQPSERFGVNPEVTVEDQSPQLELELAEDEMSDVEQGLSSNEDVEEEDDDEDEDDEDSRHRSPMSPSMSPSLSPAPYSPAEAFETDEEDSEAESWEDRDQSLSSSPPPAPQNVGNCISTSSVPALPLAAKVFAAGNYRTNFDKPINTHQQHMTFTSPMRAPSPSDAAMAKPIIPNQPATSPWILNTSNAMRGAAPPINPHPTYQAYYSGFTRGSLSGLTHSPSPWPSTQGYTDGPFSMGNREVAAMNDYQSVGGLCENSSNFLSAQMNPHRFDQPPRRSYQMFQPIPSSHQDEAEEAQNKAPTGLDRIRRLKELHEKSCKDTRKAFDAAQGTSKGWPMVNTYSTDKAWLDSPSQAAGPVQPQPTIPVAKKMSIDDIVEKQPTGPNAPAPPNQLKRKADSMTTPTNTSTSYGTMETMEDSLSQADEDFTCTLNKSRAMLAKQEAKREMAAQQLAHMKDSISPLSTEAVVEPTTESVVVEATEQAEPPAKRVKTTNATSSSNLAKYAATAVGGVILGGIGAVAALISLPPEFFA